MLTSIRSRLLASYFGMMMLAVIILGPASYLLMKHHLQEQRSANLLFMARHVAGMLDHQVLELGSRIAQIAEGRIVKEFPETARLAAVGEYFGRFKASFPSISYLDAKGWEEVKVFNGRRLSYLEDQSDSPLFKLARKHPNRSLLGSIEQTEDMAQPSLPLIYGIQRYFGDEFVGAIFARAPLSGLTRIMNDIEVGKTGYICLLENSGRILSYPDPKRILKPIPATARQEEIVKAALNGGAGVSAGTLLGVHGLVSYAPLRQLDASLLVVLPYTEFIAAPAQMRNAIFIVLLAIALAGGCVAMLLANRMTRPILGLTGAALKISEGDFPARLDLQADGEIGHLVKAFNKMVRELRHSTVSRQYFDRILGNMQEGLLLVGLDGKVVNVNQTACHLLGMDEDEILGSPLKRLVEDPGGDREDWLQTLLSKPGLRRGEKVLLTTDGPLPVSFIWTVLDDTSGKVKDVACLFLPLDTSA